MSESAISPASGSPLVTVFVGCYNHARFVVEALESVRLQTYPNIQLIIWDDCSQDNSVDVIEDWIRQHNVRCTFLAHKTNLGICKSLNEALYISKGKYISGVAADDVWLPDKTSRQVKIMESAPNDVGVVYSDALQIDENGTILPLMYLSEYSTFTHPPEGFLFDDLWMENFIPAMTTLVRHECYNQVGVYDTDFCFEDWDMWMRISRRYRFIHDTIASSKYRIVSTSMNRTMLGSMAESMDLLRVKYLCRGWLSTKQIGHSILALDRVVWRLYQRGDRIPWRWRLAILMHNLTPKAICLVICSSCRLSFVTFQEILAFGVTYKKMLSRNPAEK